MSTSSIRSPSPLWNATWRSVLYLVTFLLATLALALPVGLGYFAFRALRGDELEEITLHLEDVLLYLHTLLGLGQLLAALALTAIWMRWLDRRGRLAELGMRWPGRSPLMAFLLGMGMAALATGLAAAASKLVVTGWAWQSESLVDVLLVDLGGLAPLFLFMVLADELIFRGYIRWAFTGTARTENVAPIASAVLYGLYRVVAWRMLSDTGAQAPGTLAMVGLGGVAAGLALAWAWRVGKSLWTPIGLHLGWAWVSGLAFSMPVGGKTAEGLLLVRTAGSLLAGGAAGPEAGLMGILVWLAAWGLLYMIEQRTPGQ